MLANYVWNEADSPLALAEQLADRLVSQINQSIESNGIAVVAVSGGSTPKPLFQALAKRELDWSKLVLTLVDERWVPPGHELSNASFLQKHLLDDLPASVTFVPLYVENKGDENNIPVTKSFSELLNNYCAVTGSDPAKPHKFDAVILGMGGDGHTASFFPDADNIAELVDAKNLNYLLTCNSPSTQVQRVTWSLPMLLNTSLLALHITGQNKRKVFETAAKEGSAQELPIRSVIFQDGDPLHVYYAD